MSHKGSDKVHNHNTRGNSSKHKPIDNPQITILKKNKNASEQFVVNEIEQTKANILDSVNATLKNAIEEVTQNNNYREENNMRSRIEDLEYKITTLEDDINYLLKRNHSLESNVYELQQRSRRSNLEIHGIPNEILDENLEKTIIEILNDNELAYEDITYSDIEACHRLPGKRGLPKPVIIKFLCRKVRDEIIWNRGNLEDISLSKYGFDENHTLYINDNLSPHSKKIKFHCRNLRRDGIIKKFTFEHCNFKIKIAEGDRWHKISHEDNLYSLFPDYFTG